MLSVDIEKIIPVTEARDMFNKIVDEVEGSDEMYVLTKNGKPAAVVVGVNHLEKLTGETSGEIMTKVTEATTEPKEEEAVKPFDISPATSEEEMPKEEASNASSSNAFSATPTDSFVAKPAEAEETTQSSDFNAAPAMPEATPKTEDAPGPMAPVIDADGKNDEPEVPAGPVIPPTPTTDPFAPSATPNAGTFGSHDPAPGAASNTNATPPANN